MIAGLVLIAGAVAVASFAVKPNNTQSFDLFYGSVFLNDERAPVAVDLTNGRPTVRLVDANTQVSATKPSDLDVVPLTNGTLLLNTATGEFNVVDPTGFVIKSKDGGVPLPKRPGATTSVGIAAGASAYVVQIGPGGTSVYLVGQSTVQSATGPGARVRPRAYATMTDLSSTAPGAAASANGDLWMLVGSGRSRTVRRLSVPRGSEAGVTLDSADQATVSGVSSIGVTTGRAGGDAVAVAGPDEVRVFDGGAQRTLAVKGLIGVDSILPASNQREQLSFLYHSASGWSLVSTPVRGRLVGPDTLSRVDPAAQLAAPATSNGKLFTMDIGVTGRVWQIGSGGEVRSPPGAAQYPIVKDRAGRAVEAANFADGYAIARGSRVIFDSPNHVQGLALFTDDSHPPVLIDKSAASSVNAAGGATALLNSHPSKNAKGPAPPAKNAVKAPPPLPINNLVSCKGTAQLPHIPTITRATPGSRSVQVQWSYPLLDPRDCAPSTYGISVKLLSSVAPSPPAAVTVQGQDAVNLTGLFPDTRYQITVTAYLNGRGTPSAPVEIATGPEGPAAPTNVQTVADSSGNWTITWNSCGGVAEGCVSSATWTVIPSFCDASGLSSAPATISIAGDPTQHSFVATFSGNDSVLGRGLSFQVQGVGAKGTVGASASDHRCSFSWSPPVARNISIAASTPPPTTGQSTSSTTVAVRFIGSQIHDLGGVGGQLTYKLITGGSVVYQSGPTTATSAVLNGIRPGQHYQVAVVANPPRHPEAAVTIGPVNVAPAVAAWPGISVSATFANNPISDGTLTVAIHGVSSAGSRGERFDLVNSVLTCGGGNDVLPLEKFGFDPAAPLTFSHIARATFHGPCTVTIQLVQNAQGSTDPPFYGAGPSPSATSAQFTIDPPVLLGSTGGDFAAAWAADSTRGNPKIVVTYNNTDPLLLTFAADWSMIASNDGGTTNCGTSTSKPTATITVDKACVQAGGTFTVKITFRYFLSQPVYTVAVAGTAPQPIDPAAFSFTAGWGGTAAKPVVVIQTTKGDPTSASLSWTETVTASTSPSAVCGSAMTVPPKDPGSFTIGVKKTTCPNVAGSTTWSVTISYHDPAGVSPDFTYPAIAVTGTEP
ncbi:MAG: fibronectin type III domain-containing protein [Jatrophihabitantaceae bacterium]